MEQDEIIFDEPLSEASFYSAKTVAEHSERLTHERVGTPHSIQFSNEEGDDETLTASNGTFFGERDLMHSTDELELIKNNSSSLIEEGIAPPSVTAFLLSELLLAELTRHDITASRITASAEGGICFVFVRGDQALYIEIYNDGEIGYIIEDFRRKKILDNKDIQLSETITTVGEFLGGE